MELPGIGERISVSRSSGARSAGGRSVSFCDVGVHGAAGVAPKGVEAVLADWLGDEENSG
jgi:hypothetical protein